MGAEVLRGAWAPEAPTPATVSVSRGAEGWPSFQEAGGAVSWLQLAGRVGGGCLLPSPLRHNLLTVQPNGK